MPGQGKNYGSIRIETSPAQRGQIAEGDGITIGSRGLLPRTSQYGFQRKKERAPQGSSFSTRPLTQRGG